MKPYASNRFNSYLHYAGWQHNKGELRATFRRLDKKQARQAAQRELRVVLSESIEELEAIRVVVCGKVSQVLFRYDGNDWLDLQLGGTDITVKYYPGVGFGLWADDKSYGSKPQEMFELGKEDSLVGRIVELLLGE